ncbi:hypothetical protein ACFY36_31475 [Actinoplanes sp. NPDC000266]
MEQSNSRTVRAVGTVAALAGLVWLVLLWDSDYDAWRFLAGILTVAGLLLRIEAAIVRNGELTAAPYGPR